MIASRSWIRASSEKSVTLQSERAKAPLVVADKGADGAEVVEEVTPDRALPVMLEMAEPARDDEERRPMAVGGVGQAHAIRPATEPDLL